MSQTINSAAIKDAKRMISERSKKFEADLMKSKTAYDRILIFQEIHGIITSEIDQWLNKLSDMQEQDDDDLEETINSASVHISELSDFINTLNRYIAADLPTALNIQSAMIRTHQITQPTITLSTP